MPLEAGQVIALLSGEQYKTGLIGDEPMQAVFGAVRRVSPANRAEASGLDRTTISNANGTAQTVKSAAGKVFHVRADNTDDDAVIVQILDGAIVKAAFLCPPAVDSTQPGAGEAALFTSGAASADGTGQVFGTSIKVKAVKASDGSTGADNGCTVKVLYN